MIWPDMSRLEALLDAFLRAEIGFEELDAAVSARLEEAPGVSDDIAALLDGARSGIALPSLALPVLFAGLALFGRAAPVPRKDPMLEESLTYHT